MTRLRGLVRPLALVGAVAGIGWAIWSRHDAIAAFDWRLSWPALLASVALFAVAPLVQAFTFWLILRRLGATGGVLETCAVWSRSFLARYAPTGALGYALRVRERERLGADTSAIWAAAAYEQVIALVSGAAACVGAFLVAGVHPPLVADCLLVGGVVVAVTLRPRLAGEAVRRLLRRRGVELDALLRGRDFGLAVALNLLAWMPTGAAVAVLVSGVAGGRTPHGAWLTGAYAFAWLLGLVVPLLPAGFGLRDATLAGFLTPLLGLGVSTSLVLALRLANTVGELVAAAAVEVARYALSRRRSFASAGASGRACRSTGS
jgi:hypothetical protein